MKKFAFFALIFFSTPFFFAQNHLQDVESFSMKEFTAKLMSTINSDGIDEALNLFSSLDDSVKSDKKVQYLQASLLLSAGKAEEALAQAENLTEKFPENVDYILLTAMAAKSAGKTELKRKSLEKAIVLDPCNAAANTELANEQMLKKNWTRAKQLYQKALTEKPDYSLAILGIGKANYYLKKDDEARAAFEKTIETNENADMAYSYLAKLEVEKSNYLTAISLIKKAIEINPDYYNHWLDLGEYCKTIRNDDEAIDAFSQAVKLNDRYFLSYVLRGGMYETKEMYADALRDYLKAIQLNPKYTIVYNPAGQLAWKSNDKKLCETIYLSLSEQNPTNIFYNVMVLACKSAQKKNAEVREISSKKMTKFDEKSCEYKLIRLFYDNIGADSLVSKINEIERADERDMLLYCTAIYFESHNLTFQAQEIYQSLVEKESTNQMIKHYAELALKEQIF